MSGAPRTSPPHHRPAWIEVDLDAVARNAALLCELVTPSALCAVVKADAYGHGAPAVARAVLQGGARWLAVALVEEGIALRDAGITAPVLVLSEPPPDAFVEAIGRDLTLTLYSPEGVRAASAAASSSFSVGAAPGRGRVPVHVKVDTGMHRVGAPPSGVADVVAAVLESESLYYEGLWTHFSVADETDSSFTGEQRDCLERVVAALAAKGFPPPRLKHAANSAGAIAHPGSRLDLSRCGIALYGYAPSRQVGEVLARAMPGRELEPALTWRARVSHVAELEAGERPSYGRRRPLAERSVVATVPVGYHDGAPRLLLDGGGEVLIGGRRRPLAGTVTMDQIVVDCGPVAGPGRRISVGDDVVLIGEQGDARLTAEDWAGWLRTISYEVLCGIGPRVPRVYVGGGGS